MIKGNSYGKSRGLLVMATLAAIAAGILLDSTGVLALVSLGVGIGFLLGLMIKG